MRKASLLAIAALAWPVSAQQPLALKQAIEIALQSNPIIQAAEAGEGAADEGVREARAGYLPRLRYAESWQRSNNPVFAFGSLLNQGLFTERNFQVDLLNNPDAINNFQSRVFVEQVIFDSHRTKRAIQAARLGSDIAAEQRRGSETDVILGVVRTYLGVLLGIENLRVAEESVKTAEADLKRAEARYEAGMTTQADALSVRVHLAAIEQERIRAAQDSQVARAALNDALGVPLDTSYELTTPLTKLTQPPPSVADYELRAIQNNPGLRQAELGATLAQTQLDLAKTSLWPQVVAHGIFEADRQRFVNRGAANWLGGVSLQWDIWSGSEKRARVAAARFTQSQAEALGRRADSAVRLQVRRAHAELDSAAQRVEVAAQAVSAAEESHRIIQNRYEAGLTTVTELIRSQTALIAARTRHLATLYDQRVAAAGLEHAAGTLTPSSAVLD